MNPESSPFCPGHLAPPELFTGRQDKAECLRSMLRACARQGRLKTGFIYGERGIGKSSLASFIRREAETKENILGTHIPLGSVQSLDAMLQRTFNTLAKESLDKPWHKPFQEFLNRIQKVGVFGITFKLAAQEQDLPPIAENFVPAIQNLLNEIQENQKKALLLIFDNVNGLAASPQFAHWFKSASEEIDASNQKNPLCILFVGLQEQRRELINNQPSLARVFELVKIDPWTNDETAQFYQRAFAPQDIDISKDSLSLLIRFTSGLPVFAHELGDALWRIAPRPKIRKNDVKKSILSAAETIGERWIEPQILSSLRSERYRSILRKIAADHPKMQFRKTEIIKKLNKEETKVLNNFLQRMEELNAIKKDPETQGGYQFPSPLHALYFHLEARRAKQTIDPNILLNFSKKTKYKNKNR